MFSYPSGIKENVGVKILKCICFAKSKNDETDIQHECGWMWLPGRRQVVRLVLNPQAHIKRYMMDDKN